MPDDLSGYPNTIRPIAGEPTHRIRNLLCLAWRPVFRGELARAHALRTHTHADRSLFGKVSCYAAILIPAIKNWTSEK